MRQKIIETRLSLSSMSFASLSNFNMALQLHRWGRFSLRREDIPFCTGGFKFSVGAGDTGEPFDLTTSTRGGGDGRRGGYRYSRIMNSGVNSVGFKAKSKGLIRLNPLSCKTLCSKRSEMRKQKSASVFNNLYVDFTICMYLRCFFLSDYYCSFVSR